MVRHAGKSFASSLLPTWVLAKQAAGRRWCELATEHARTHGGKPWRYALISHERVQENMSLEALAGS